MRFCPGRGCKAIHMLMLMKPSIIKINVKPLSANFVLLITVFSVKKGFMYHRTSWQRHCNRQYFSCATRKTLRYCGARIVQVGYERVECWGVHSHSVDVHTKFIAHQEHKVRMVNKCLQSLVTSGPRPYYDEYVRENGNDVGSFHENYSRIRYALLQKLPKNNSPSYDEFERELNANPM